MNRLISRSSTLTKCIFLATIMAYLWLPFLHIGLSQVQANSQNAQKIFLPLVANGYLRGKATSVMLGVYTDGYLGQTATIVNEVQAIDNWAGKKNSIVGTFIAIEDEHPDYNIPVPLGNIFDAGYTPFVNLETTHTLDEINNGSLDDKIKAMAIAFKTWHDIGISKSQNRRAFLAPLQEMNGYWVSYHDNDTSKFKSAYTRIQNIFAQNGASSAVWWVFAPNGWSDPTKNDPPFEQYYPGDSQVDAVAFSSYNSGYCSSAVWKAWDNADKVFTEYMDRMTAMAPTKGIIVAQTGTSGYIGNNVYSETSKGQWLVESYQLLASYKNTIGIVYFNKGVNQTCDWPFYKINGTQIEGYITAVGDSSYDYVPPAELVARTNLLP